MSVSPKGIKHRSLGWQIDFAPRQNLEILKGMNDGKYEFLRVRREFRHPFVTGAGSFSHMDRIIIKTEENGVVGFGEVAPWPNFKTENIRLDSHEIKCEQSEGSSEKLEIKNEEKTASEINILTDNDENSDSESKSSDYSRNSSESSKESDDSEESSSENE